MTSRVFISYRSSDGADKATALARELDALFGDEQVFIDKQNLPAGSHWRREIEQTLGRQPILLVLVTPDYLGARDEQGRLRVHGADDPVCSELAVALRAGAHIIPLLCDGHAATPDFAAQGAPLNQLAERTWRSLRTHDWPHDVARLATDLQALGVEARHRPGRPPASRRQWAIGLGAVGAAAVAGLVGVVGIGGMDGTVRWPWRPSSAALPGRWVGALGRRGAVTVDGGTSLQFELEQDGITIRMTSVPAHIESDPDWAEYRSFWLQQFGTPLTHVVYRGEGEVRADPGVPVALSLVMRVEARQNLSLVDSGGLDLELDGDGRRLHGQLWLNSDQANRVIELQRAP
jgi:hypothetical protein